MIKLENWHYRFNGFYFRLYGEVYGHPNHDDGTAVYISTPEFFNETKMIVIGISGKEYQLGKCGTTNILEQIEYIREEVLRVNNERLI